MAYLLWHYLRDSAQRHPDRTAVQSENESLSYRQLDERSTRPDLGGGDGRDAAAARR